MVIFSRGDCPRTRGTRRPCRTDLMAYTYPASYERRVQNIIWREHETKAEIYGDIPLISSIVACHRTRFAGHCFRAKDQMISNVISLRLPCPTRGRTALQEILGMRQQTCKHISVGQRYTWRGIVYSISDASAK